MSGISGLPPERMPEESDPAAYKKTPRLKKLWGQHTVIDKTTGIPFSRYLSLKEKLLAIINRGPASDKAIQKAFFPDSADRFVTAFKQASSDQRLEMIQHSPPVRLSAKDKNGNTYLHIACEVGDIKSIKAILKKDPSATSIFNKSMQSPLAVAVASGNKEVAMALIENSHIVPDLLAVETALANGHTEIAEALAERSTQKNDIKIKLDLLTGKLNPTDHPDHYRELVYTIIQYGSVETLEKLFDAEPMNRTLLINKDLQQNPFHLACSKGKDEIVQFLLDRLKPDAAYLNQKDRAKKTPLMHTWKLPTTRDKLIKYANENKVKLDIDRATSVNLMNEQQKLP